MKHRYYLYFLLLFSLVFSMQDRALADVLSSKPFIASFITFSDFHISNQQEQFFDNEIKEPENFDETEEAVDLFKKKETAPFNDKLPLLSDNKKERLDALFKILQSTQNSLQARRAKREILLTWTRSDSKTLDLLLMWASQAIEKKNYSKALDYLDNIIRLDPHFSEGWNKRANVYFLQQEFSKSIADLEQALALEPRHFNALSGLGIILQKIGEEKRALMVFQRAFDLNPTMTDLIEIIDKLEKKVKGRES